jgi:hypothetical protein
MLNGELMRFKSFLDEGLSPELKPVYEAAVSAQRKIDSYRQNDLVSAKAVDQVFEEGKKSIIDTRDQIFRKKADEALKRVEVVKAKHTEVLTDSEIARRTYELTLFTNKVNFKGLEHAEQLVTMYGNGEIVLNIDELHVLGNYLDGKNSQYVESLRVHMDVLNAEEPYLSDPEYIAAAKEYNQFNSEIGSPTLLFETRTSFGQRGELLIIDSLLN